MQVTIKFTLGDYSIDTFISQLRADIRHAVSQLGDYAQELLENSIQSRLYGSISGHYATGTIASAHELEINGMSFELYMEPSKVAMFGPGPGQIFGYNQSLDGGDYREQLVHGFDEGGIPASPYRNYALPETAYFTAARKEIETKAVQKLASILRGMGYRVSGGS